MRQRVTSAIVLLIVTFGCILASEISRVLFFAAAGVICCYELSRNLEKLDVAVVIGIGGTFNFIAGKVKRAPKWMQKCGLEWIYRIVQEPKRLWRRYTYGLVKFSWLSLLHLFGGYGK